MRAIIIALLAIALLAIPVAAHDGRYEPPHGHDFIHAGDIIDRVPHQYHWDANWNGWVDDRCDGDENFRLYIFKHEGYSGARTRVCHSSTNSTGTPNNDTWCEIPLGWKAGVNAVKNCRNNGARSGVANDNITSVGVFGLGGNYCLRLFGDENHGYRWMTLEDGDSHSDLGDVLYPNTGMDFNDRVSSTKRKAGGACDNAFGQN